MGEASETDFTTEVHSLLEQPPLAQTARNEPTSEVDKLRRRLNTYTQWSSKKSSLQLATAGFIYTGITDKVECQSCGIRLYNWQEDEDPLQAHKKYAPDCEFMLTNFPNVKAPPKPKKILTVKYPHYSDYETRLRSFDSWPLHCVAQKPEMMARSGFFYIGSADRARCFHCGVTLKDWDTDDYPPCAHRQWSENCPYVQQIDVDGMKKEIDVDNDVYQEWASSIRCRSVPVEGNDVSLRQNIKLDSNVQRKDDITLYITSGQRLEFTWRGTKSWGAVTFVTTLVIPFGQQKGANSYEWERGLS